MLRPWEEVTWNLHMSRPSSWARARPHLATQGWAWGWLQKLPAGRIALS